MPDDRPWGQDSEMARPEGIQAGDYPSIEDAVMETPRGRWFLREYARRIRAAETSDLLAAFARLELAIAQRLDPAAASPSPSSSPTPTPTPTPSPTLAASQSVSPPGDGVRAADADCIMAVQEKLLDIVWYMRERGFDGRLCTAISTEANKLIHLPQEDGAADGSSLCRAAGPDEAVAPTAAESCVAGEAEAQAKGAADDETPAVDLSCDDFAGAAFPLPDYEQDIALAEAGEIEIAEIAAVSEDIEPFAAVSAAPSKVAALAQKAACFAAIDRLPDCERLALFS